MKLTYINFKSFYILYLLINFLLKNGKKVKLTKLIFKNLYFLTKKYNLTINYIFLIFFYIWRPLLELRTVSTKTQKYTIGVPIKDYRLFYILFKTHFIQLKKKKKTIFNQQFINIFITLFNNKHNLLLPNILAFDEAYKNRAFLHFRKYINR